VASVAAAYAPTRAIRFRPQRAFHPRYGRCALYRVTQSTPLCIASLTFMGDLRCWSWVHSMKCSAPVPRYSLYNGSAPPVCLGCPADARSPESVSKFR
jgi:hypothetical protein